MAIGYASSLDHLTEELARVDQLVRAQTERWRTTIAATKPDEAWGMGYVDDAEVNRYLATPFSLSSTGPAPVSRAANAQAANIAARVKATPRDVPLRLDQLATRFGLDDAERDVLLLCLLPELDSRYRRLYGYLHDDVSQGGASVGLLDEMLAPPPFGARRRLAPGSRLIASELIVLGPWTAAEGPSRRSVRVEDRIIDHLTGSDHPDARLAGALSDLTRPAAIAPLTPAEAALVDGLAAQPGARIVLTGADPRTRRAVAAAIGARIGRPVLLAAAPAAGTDHGAHLISLAYREATLRSAVLLWEGCEALFDRGRPLPAWMSLLAAASQYQRPTLIDHAAPWDPEDRAESTPLVRWPLARPDVAARQARWTAVLPLTPDRDALARRLAETFDLTAAQIQDAATLASDIARTAPPEDTAARAEHLLEACRRQSGRRLLTFTERVPVPAGLDLDSAIVLPPEQRQQLHDLVDRIRLRNVLAERHPDEAWRRPKGVVCLFTGWSGTGKTLAAACVASALGKDLLRVDLPAVVSKWVGETEKNLQQVFAEAEDANAVMFFDEAEAFFAQRGDIKGAQDRWAMMETDYLLQRIENYTGAVILATNLRQHIDEAFFRRIHVSVEFPHPDKDQRAVLWTRALSRRHPEMTPGALSALFAIPELAERHSFTGAAIESICETAELQALSQPSPDHPGLLAGAIRQELRKTGRVF
jgi:hypothetical protein